jgi:hypothetical protein
MSRVGRDGSQIVAIGYSAAHSERGKVDVFRSKDAMSAKPEFELVRTIDCASCKVGTRFGLDVDLSASGDRLLVTMRSQDVDPSLGLRGRARRLISFDQVHEKAPGMRTIAYLFDQDGELIQSFRHDEREEDGIDFLEVDWRGQISTKGDRVTLTSWYSHKQTRTLVFDSTSGAILSKSKTDYLIAVDADQRRGIGLSTNPDGIYVYKLETTSVSSSAPASTKSVTTGCAVAAVLAVVIVGMALIFVFKGRRRTRKTINASGTSEPYEDEPGKGGAIDLPSLT